MSTHPWKKNYPNEGQDFTKIEINMPREMRNWLEEWCGTLKMPPWRLICIALDNERELVEPFNFPTATPNTRYVPHAYSDEAQKILDFLQKFKYGIGRDMLLLFRHQIGIPLKSNVLHGVRELIEQRHIEETENFKRKSFLEYPEGYTHLRALKVPQASQRKIEQERREMAKLEARLARKKKNLEIMEGNPHAGPTRKKTPSPASGEE